MAVAFRTAQPELYRGGHMLTQAALAEFIDTGRYAAHIRKMRLVYAARRAFLVSRLHPARRVSRVGGLRPAGRPSHR